MIRRILAATGVLLALTVPAAAAEPGRLQGWWTTSNVGGAIPASATGADVPPDGLLVQGGVSDGTPTAIAALAVPLPSGADVQAVVVHVAATSATVPGSVIKACPLRSPRFASAQGGPIADAPAYDCTHSAVAPVGADGTTFSFSVAGLVADGVVAVALVPGSSTTRVVLAKPGDDVLGIATPPTPPTPATSEPPASEPVPRVPSITAPPVGMVLPPVLTPSLTPNPGVGTPPVIAGETAPSIYSPTSFGGAGSPSANALAILAFVGLLAGAGYAWRRSARSCRAISRQSSVA